MRYHGGHIAPLAGPNLARMHHVVRSCHGVSNPGVLFVCMFHISTRMFSQASPFRSSFSPRLVPKAWDLESPHLLQSMFKLYTEALGLGQQPWRTCFPLSMLHALLKTQFLQHSSIAGFERAGYRSHRLMFENNRCTYLVSKQSPCSVE
jgi:hypothetical protein